MFGSLCLLESDRSNDQRTWYRWCASVRTNNPRNYVIWHVTCLHRQKAITKYFTKETWWRIQKWLHFKPKPQIHPKYLSIFTPMHSFSSHKHIERITQNQHFNTRMLYQLFWKHSIGSTAVNNDSKSCYKPFFIDLALHLQLIMQIHYKGIVTQLAYPCRHEENIWLK